MYVPLDDDEEEQEFYSKPKKVRKHKFFKAYGWVFYALALGALLYFSHTFFTSSNVLLRMTGISPAEARGFSGFSIMLAFWVGLLCLTLPPGTGQGSH
jgi:hypothetical protein